MKKYFIELKNRFILFNFSMFSLMLVSYYYKEIILFLIIKPSLNINNNFDLYYFIFTDVTEIFSVYLIAIIFVVIQISTFFLLYQMYSFLSFALYKKEFIFLKQLLKFFFIAWFFAFITASFFVIPISWDFFLNFQSLLSSKLILLYFEPKISEYLNFCVSIYSLTLFYFLIFAVLFFIVNHFTKSINPLKKFRKLYYYSFLVFSTTVTPPDIFNQLFFSVVLIFFFELFIIIFVVKNLLIRKIIKTN